MYKMMRMMEKKREQEGFINQPQPLQQPQSTMLPPLAISGRSAPMHTVQPSPHVVAAKVADLSNGQKFRAATLLTIAFAILSLPQSFRLSNSVYTYIFNKGSFITESGETTLVGTVFHTIIFMIIALYVLYKK